MNIKYLILFILLLAGCNNKPQEYEKVHTGTILIVTNISGCYKSKYSLDCWISTDRAQPWRYDITNLPGGYISRGDRLYFQYLRIKGTDRVKTDVCVNDLCNYLTFCSKGNDCWNDLPIEVQ